MATFTGTNLDETITPTVVSPTVTTVGGLVPGSTPDDLFGGGGADVLAGGGGSDQMFGGTGDDRLVWNPGDGNDLMEGGDGFDTLDFNGSNASESIALSNNGGRLLFFRDVASINLDVNDVEKVSFDALGGTDSITVGDLSGTDVTQVEINLAGQAGGGDGAADTVTVNGAQGSDSIVVSSGGPGSVLITGLPTTVSVLAAEAANDRLIINAQGGDDVIDAAGLQAGFIGLTINAGLGNDIVLGSSGDDIVNGGDGNDIVLLRDGNDTFIWNPGDDNDRIEGQAGADTLDFRGSNASESITISASNGRTAFLRDVANVTMDLNDVERIVFAALGGTDTIVVNDLTGADVTQVVLDLAQTAGSSDGQVDTITVNGGAAGNVVSLSTTAGSASVVVLAADASDIIQVNTLGGADTINAAAFAHALAIDGGTELDTVSYEGGNAVTVDLFTQANNAGGATGHTYVSIENVVGSSAADSLTGDTGANVLTGGGGADVLNGGDSDDTFRYLAGSDAVAGETVNAGAGALDTIALVNTGAINFTGVTISGVERLAFVSGNSTATFGGNPGFSSVVGGAGTDAIIINGDSVFFSPGSFTNWTNGIDSITLNGTAANSTLFGSTQNDTINGGGGGDAMSGGFGNDNYVVDNIGDVVTESISQGNDSVFSSISVTLPQNVESVILQEAGGAINVTGHINANGAYLIGNSATNILADGGGKTVLLGKGGNDLYSVTNSQTVIGENANEGNDAVYATVNHTLAANVETLILQGTANLVGNGSAGANQLFGNSGANQLNGRGGADLLRGFGGDDSFVFAKGEANGDVIADFTGNGAAAGDRLIFTGYNIATATLTQLTATTWRVSDGTINETITLQNGATLHPSDFMFV